MGTPIYLMIKESLLDEIQMTQPDTPISSERKLATFYQVSRMTVRNAINELVEEGVLYRDKNKGTFVANPKRIKKNTSAEALQRKQAADFEILFVGMKNAGHEMAPRLEVKPEDQILRTVHLNKKNQNPLSIEEVYYRRDMISDEEASNPDRLMEMKQYIERGAVIQRFFPIVVPVKYTKLLHMKMNRPMIMVESTIMGKDGRPSVYIREYNNPDEKVIEITS